MSHTTHSLHVNTGISLCTKPTFVRTLARGRTGLSAAPCLLVDVVADAGPRPLSGAGQTNEAAVAAVRVLGAVPVVSPANTWCANRRMVKILENSIMYFK